MINTNFLQKKSGSVGEKFDGKEYPVLALNFQTVIHLYVSDPELAQDIFIGKNGMHDKDSEGLLMFQDIIGQSFIFAHNDDAWKKKRQGCAHAFYKDRLASMNESLKDRVSDIYEKWASTIDT